MDNLLKKIIESKKREVHAKKNNLEMILRERSVAVPSTKMRKALKQKHVAVIAEIKRKSPNAGLIGERLDPVKQSLRYLSGGASAISVLTDFSFFGGTIEDLTAVAVQHPNMPVLMKDFVIDPIQIIEGALAGASAILLIVAVLGKMTISMLEEVRRQGLEALVEVHNQEELAIALDAGADIIGVNSRNLKTFQVDLKHAEDLAALFPPQVIKVAESGIKTVEDVQRMRACGYHAVLVGETLVRAEDPEAFIRSFRLGTGSIDE
jgi:indole-3-glycerol phosphate synthase